MKTKNKLGMAGLAILIVAVVTITGCIGGGGDKPTMVQTGSSTVLPLAIAWAAEFDDADITVSGGGSSHGINALLNGEADLGDASRLMKGSDYEKVGGSPDLVKADGTASAASPTGVWPYKWVVAYDVLTVVVNNDNDWSTQLNYSQLYQIFSDDSPAVYWDDVDGLTGAPHEEIEIYAPDAASGTYDYFFDEIVPRWGKDDQQADSRLNSDDNVYNPSADDNVILNAVKSNRYAIGFFGFAYYKENQGSIRTVEIAQEDDYVAPSLATVADYPMARPLYIYTDGVPENGDIRNTYLSYILGEEGQSIVPEVGYVKLGLVDQPLLNKQRSQLENA